MRMGLDRCTGTAFTLKWISVPLLALALAFLAAPVSGDDATSYRIDNARTRGEFEVGHFGMLHTQGRFAQLSGRLTFDAAAKSGSIVLDIVTASVVTDWDARDDFIRGESMFDAAHYPRILFQSTRFEFADDKLARVDLTLRGVKRPIVLDVRSIDCGRDTCIAQVNGTIRRREFGMDAMWPMLGDDVELRFRVYGVKE